MSNLTVKFKDTAAEFTGIIVAIRAFIDKFIRTYADEIIACPEKGDFLKLVAQLGDDLYQGNIMTEAIDYEVFKFILNKGVSPLLDKIFGPDWFVIFKSQAINLKSAVSGDTNIPAA